MLQILKVGPGDEAIFDNAADGVFDEAINGERLAAYLRDPQHHMMLAIIGGQVVGQVAAVIYRHPDKAPELFIDEVGVAPAFQRRGIARQLMDHMLGLGRNLGCEAAWVGTEHGNTAARNLYASYGASAEPFVMYTFKL
jgi:aminoglycoside 6'-N-acetyltransferase I